MEKQSVSINDLLQGIYDNLGILKQEIIGRGRALEDANAKIRELQAENEKTKKPEAKK